MATKMKTGPASVQKDANVAIKPVNFEWRTFRIIGTAPLVQSNFNNRMIEEVMKTQSEGQSAKNKKKRQPRDFHQQFQNAMHRLPDGSCALPASAFRSALVSACRVAGFVMTRAKLSVFVEADGYDPESSTPLIRITKGEPEFFVARTRNATGVMDVRARARWQPGWEASVTVRYDADQFTADDIVALMDRVGQQVGIGEGRADSPNSCGMGWGAFRLATEDDGE